SLTAIATKTPKSRESTYIRVVVLPHFVTTHIDIASRSPEDSARPAILNIPIKNRITSISTA
ncbi:MAG: hypothetical protein QXK14_02745, partial [Acidilobaceae archaeon]